MIPYVISFAQTNKLENMKNHYGKVSRVEQINNVIFDFVKELTVSYSQILKFNDSINWSNFCSCVNSNTYDNSLFFSIK